MSHLYDSAELGEKKKITRSKIKGIGRLLHYGDIPLGQEQPNT